MPLLFTTTAAAPHFGPPRIEGAPALFTLKGANPLALERLKALGWTPDPDPKPAPAAEPVELMPVASVYAKRRGESAQLTATRPEPATTNPSGELTLMPTEDLYAKRRAQALATRHPE